jgi:hypothetical protein
VFFDLDAGGKNEEASKNFVHEIDALIILSRVVPVNSHLFQVWGFCEDLGYEVGSLAE